MNKFNYKIKLTPIDKFYFGSTQSFGTKNENTYILTSEKWPQQTTLLGMLRKEILVQTGNIRENYENLDIKKWIGKESFKFYSDKTIEQDYGVVKGISTVFIEDENEKKYTAAPLDHNNNSQSCKYRPFEVVKSLAKTYRDGKEKEIPCLVRSDAQFNPKGYLSQDYICIEDFSIVREEDCIRKVEQIGINRAAEENGLYKLNSYKFMNRQSHKFAFVFYAKIDEDCLIDKTLQNNIVQVGNKHSLFKMSICKVEEDMISSLEKIECFECLNSNQEKIKFKRCIALSDIYLDEQDIKLIDSGIIQTRIFKYIHNISGKRRFKPLKESYTFISRGSVFYCKEENIKQLELAVESYKNLRKIGYNFILKGENNE